MTEVRLRLLGERYAMRVDDRGRASFRRGNGPWEDADGSGSRALGDVVRELARLRSERDSARALLDAVADRASRQTPASARLRHELGPLFAQAKAWLGAAIAGDL